MVVVSARGWVLFAAMSVIWGVPYLMIKVAVEEVSVPLLIFTRSAVGAALLLPLALSRQSRTLLRRHWKAVAGFAFFEMIAAWLMLSDAERHLTSSLTGLLIAAAPIIAAVLDRLTGGERLSALRAVGLGVGLAGVGVLAGPGLTLPTHALAGRTYWAIAGLAGICTALAFVLFFALIREVGPTRALIFTYVNPAVALLAGVLILREPLTWWNIAGLVLILAGSVLATRPAQAVRQATAPSSP